MFPVREKRFDYVEVGLSDLLKKAKEKAYNIGVKGGAVGRKLTEVTKRMKKRRESKKRKTLRQMFDK